MESAARRPLDDVRPHVAAGRVQAFWVPAHTTAEEYRALGLDERDRVGNDAAEAANNVADVDFDLPEPQQAEMTASLECDDIPWQLVVKRMGC